MIHEAYIYYSQCLENHVPALPITHLAIVYEVFIPQQSLERGSLTRLHGTKLNLVNRM